MHQDSMTGLTPVGDGDLAMLLLVREFELRLLDLFSREHIGGTTHTCLGQEYIPVALSALLRERDAVFSNHRGHGHYLCRFDDPEGLLAEIMGREGGICNGVGGSQHLYRDGYLSTGVQGESLPVAAGVAHHLKRSSPGALAVVYIGDGTWGEGSVYEALNIARLWDLPLLVVVENNGIAQSTPTRMQMAGTIEGRALGFGIGYLRVSSADINGIRAQLAPLLERARAIPSPLIVEFVTQRLGPHSKGDDTRDREEMERLEAAGWYRLYQSRFPEQTGRVGALVRDRLDRVVHAVQSRPYSRWRNS